MLANRLTSKHVRARTLCAYVRMVYVCAILSRLGATLSPPPLLLSPSCLDSLLPLRSSSEDEAKVAAEIAQAEEEATEENELQKKKYVARCQQRLTCGVDAD